MFILNLEIVQLRICNKQFFYCIYNTKNSCYYLLQNVLLCNYFIRFLNCQYFIYITHFKFKIFTPLETNIYNFEDRVWFEFYLGACFVYIFRIAKGSSSLRDYFSINFVYKIYMPNLLHYLFNVFVVSEPLSLQVCLLKKQNY